MLSRIILDFKLAQSLPGRGILNTVPIFQMRLRENLRREAYIFMQLPY